MTQKIIKTGNSVAVTIPAEMAHSLNLKAGDKAEARINFSEGSVVYIFPDIRQLRLEEREKSQK